MRETWTTDWEEDRRRKLLVEFYNFGVARDFSGRDLIVFRIDRRGIIADSFLVFFSNSGRNSEEINDHKQGDERLQGELPEIFVHVRVHWTGKIRDRELVH